jgi:hypothetical protein
VASLNKSTSEILQKISTELSIEFDVYISRSLWSKTFDATRISEKDLVVSANINIYGDMPMSEAVGRALSTSHSYLQKPVYLEPEKVYQNPQCVRFPGIEPQKEVLDFIAQREFGPVPTRFSLWKDVVGMDNETIWSVDFHNSVVHILR